MKKRLLLVDAKGEFRRLLMIFLSKEYDVKTAENGLEAVMMLYKGYMPDIIVPNVMMPEVDVKTLVYQLSSSDELCDIPLLLISNRMNSTDRIEPLNTGAHENCLIKPFNLHELKNRIETSLNSIT